MLTVRERRPIDVAAHLHAVVDEDLDGLPQRELLGDVGAGELAADLELERVARRQERRGDRRAFDRVERGAVIRHDDVLVGEVWLGSGQSNMEMGIGMCRVSNEIAAANFPRIRLLTVPKKIAYKPELTLQCSWVPCSPTTVTQGGWGGFSAAGYYFGRELHKQLGVPVGLIDATWGGTRIEPWTPPAGFKAVRALAQHGDELLVTDQAYGACRNALDFSLRLQRAKGSLLHQLAHYLV